jgi:glucan phosphoethanolaminetransferase (alkaline phosphatase superfamily)
MVSVSDIQLLFDEHSEIVWFYAPLLFGYLYHLNPEDTYLASFVVTTFPPAIIYVDKYNIRRDMWEPMDIVRGLLTMFCMYFIISYPILPVYGVYSVYFYINGEEILTTAFFFSGVYLLIHLSILTLFRVILD